MHTPHCQITTSSHFHISPSAHRSHLVLSSPPTAPVLHNECYFPELARRYVFPKMHYHLDCYYSDSFMTLATITPSSSQNKKNLSQKSPPSKTPPWLAEIYRKLWRKQHLFGEVFRTANLTKADFIKLQSQLQKLNPERSSESYVAKDILATKSAFLCARSTPLSDTDLGKGLVPRLVFDASPSPCVMEDGADDTDDGDDADGVADDARDIDPDPGSSGCSHVNTDTAYRIFPCTIRYMDLTVLKLEKEIRVPLLMLLRNEWGDMIDIFNDRKKGIRGSAAVFTGQPGIGEHHYRHLTHTSNQRTRKNKPVVFHPCPLLHSRPASRVSRYGGRCLHQ
jgi:hypothetical protein